MLHNNTNVANFELAGDSNYIKRLAIRVGMLQTPLKHTTLVGGHFPYKLFTKPRCERETRVLVLLAHLDQGNGNLLCLKLLTF